MNTNEIKWEEVEKLQEYNCIDKTGFQWELKSASLLDSSIWGAKFIDHYLVKYNFVDDEMFKVVREHPKVFWAVIIIIIVVSILSVYEKQKYKANPYEKQIGNPPRENKVFDDNFYYEKLTDNEKKAYEKIKDAIVNFKGGELTFDSPLNGKEYSRVTQALYCGEDDLFYAIVNVPMTENNQSVSSVTKNITDIKEQTIVKCIILLYPAEGINEQGDIDDQGYVKNLEDLKNPLATMNEDKKSTVLKMQQASEEILNKVVSDMPKEYGKKQAIDYFLDWMDKNLILDSDTMENTDKLSNMTEVFEKNYFEGCTSCVVDGKAVATGYSKVLTRLCNKAGISAHMTIGSWKYSGSYTLVNVDFEGKQVYIDASGCKKDDLWNQRYISDTLMARNMTISDLFNDEK